MTEVQISSQVLRDAGTKLGQVGSQLDGALKQLENDLLSLGTPWGDDQIGQLIGVAYKEVVDWGFQCLKGVLDDIVKSGTDLVQQAQQWETQEQSILDEFMKQLGLLGSG
jgi:hypothetical protein